MKLNLHAPIVWIVLLIEMCSEKECWRVVALACRSIEGRKVLTVDKSIPSRLGDPSGGLYCTADYDPFLHQLNHCFEADNLWGPTYERIMDGASTRPQRQQETFHDIHERQVSEGM